MARTRRSAEGMRLAAASVILGVAILGAAGIRSGRAQEGDPEGKAREKVERGLEHLGGGQERKDDAAPDLILAGGSIWTGDPQRPRVEAVAIRGDRIVATGSAVDVRALAGEGTRTLDLGGGFACPGLVDGHAHVAGLGRAKRSLDLVGTGSWEEIVGLVKERAAAAKGNEWITGRGWDQNDWSEKAFPTHEALSEAAPDRPVWLIRIDGHAGIANAAALKRAGITAATADPEGGRVLRHPDTGEPTGVFVDEAMGLVASAMPPSSRASVRADILAAQAACLAAGLTEVHDAGIDYRTVEIYRELDGAGELKMRVYGMAAVEDADLERIRRRYFPSGPSIASGKGRFELRSIKMYADGALGSRGAALLDDYSDEPGNRGLILTPREDLLAVTRWAISRGIQVGVHAIGDRANRLVLDVYEEALEGWEGPSPRLRVEHAQVIAPEDIPRFARLGVIPAMQATHCTSDMPWAPARLGAGRVKGAYAWRALLESGARIANGSDFPVESENPLWGIYASVTRQDHGGEPEDGWAPEQRLTMEEALRSFTIDAAYAGFAEEDRGIIAPGRAADIVVLEKDPFEGPPRALLENRVRATIVAGEVVHGALDDSGEGGP